MADSWGAGFFPDLEIEGPSVRKGVDGEDGYSGFTVRHHETGKEIPTELGSILREGAVGGIVVVGLATDYCVKEIAIDATKAGFRATVLADGICAVNLKPGDGARAVAAMVAAGVSIA